MSDWIDLIAFQNIRENLYKEREQPCSSEMKIGKIGHQESDS